MTETPIGNPKETWSLPIRSDRVWTVRVNRNIVLTLLLSALLHLALLWLFQPKLFSMGAPVEHAPPLQITLGPPQKEEVAPSEAVPPTPAVKPAQPKTVKKRQPVKARPPKQVKRVDVPVAKQSENKISKVEKLNSTVPKPQPPDVSSQPLPGEDMQAYIQRQRKAKLAKQGLSKQDVEAVMASRHPQSAGDKRDAKIKANLDLEGSNGIFQIRALGTQNAQFSFKGWKNNVNTARLEIIDVQAHEGEDIKRAVIRRMIEIIRRDYSGDFNWDSRRLGRVIVLSARQQDTAGLESFMMHEFFGPGAPYASRY